MDNNLKTACYFFAAGGLGLALTFTCSLLSFIPYMGPLYQLTFIGSAIMIGLGTYVLGKWHEEYTATRRNRKALKG